VSQEHTNRRRETIVAQRWRVAVALTAALQVVASCREDPADARAHGRPVYSDADSPPSVPAVLEDARERPASQHGGVDGGANPNAAPLDAAGSTSAARASENARPDASSESPTVGPCWTRLPSADAPSARASHAAVWTGQRMVIWGGLSAAPTKTPASGGAQYDPSGARWFSMSSADVPARAQLLAGWSGLQVLVWGGGDQEGHTAQGQRGARYEPAADAWSAMALDGAPVGRTNSSSIWTGEEFLVWGGVTRQLPGRSYLSDGGRYAPATNTWRSLATAEEPSARFNHSAIWTGSEMIIWGGQGTPDAERTGGAYDPRTDRWTRKLSSPSSISSFERHTAVWTGREMIVWRGSGAAYDPGADRWRELSGLNAPSARTHHTAIWTGTHMIVFGGRSEDGLKLSDGGLYDPAADAWTPLATCGAPTPRSGHTAVWTGVAMIVWGGLGPTSALEDGAIYTPQH
jgi:N-acetylneuraminic acid mutarotase